MIELVVNNDRKKYLELSVAIHKKLMLEESIEDCLSITSSLFIDALMSAAMNLSASKPEEMEEDSYLIAHSVTNLVNNLFKRHGIKEAKSRTFIKME